MKRFSSQKERDEFWRGLQFIHQEQENRNKDSNFDCA